MRKRITAGLGALAVAASLGLGPTSPAQADTLMFPCSGSNGAYYGMNCQKITPNYREAKVAYTSATASGNVVLKSHYNYYPQIGAGGRVVAEVSTRNRYFGSWDYPTAIKKFTCIDRLTVSKVGFGMVAISGGPSAAFSLAGDSTWQFQRDGVLLNPTAASCGLNGTMEILAGAGTSITGVYWSTETRVEFVNGYSTVVVAGNGGTLDSHPYYLPPYTY